MAAKSRIFLTCKAFLTCEHRRATTCVGCHRPGFLVSPRRLWPALALIVALAFVPAGPGGALAEDAGNASPQPRVDRADGKTAEKPQEGKEAKKPSPYEWRDLFDGKALDDWKAPQFGGEGSVRVQDGAIILERGETMTGVTYTGKDLPKTNYEIEWVAKRTDGIDFFATATFPVGESFCSFVTGGWGGTIVGLSSINFYDASDNETTQFKSFKDNQWYKFRVRVTQAKIEAWIDGEKVVDFVIGKNKIGTRFEVELCKPLGFSSWCSTGVIKSVRLRQLTPDEVKVVEDEAKTRPY
ncbi:MAG: 3-keto-disaccharide hydrolase [Thermogutta sp.]